MYCDKCGAVIDGDSNYCDACGKILKENKNGKIDKFIIVDEEELKKEEPTVKVINIKKILMISGVIILTLAVFSLAVIKVYSVIKVNHIKHERTVNREVKEITTDWTEGEFILDGVRYSLNTNFKVFEYNNWRIDDTNYNYSNMSFIKNDKTSVSVPIIHNKYDSTVKIGIINLEESKKDITRCEVWGITVNNTSKEKPVKFQLSKGIKNNSTKEEIIKKYGELDSSKITENEDNVILHYQKDYSIYLDLTISNENGLEAFSYKKY